MLGWNCQDQLISYSNQSDQTSFEFAYFPHQSTIEMLIVWVKNSLPRTARHDVWSYGEFKSIQSKGELMEGSLYKRSIKRNQMSSKLHQYKRKWLAFALQMEVGGWTHQVTCYNYSPNRMVEYHNIGGDFVNHLHFQLFPGHETCSLRLLCGIAHLVSLNQDCQYSAVVRLPGLESGRLWVVILT